MADWGKLVIAAPGEEPQTILLDRPILRIGRLPPPDNDLPLAHSLISRRHAQIFCDRQPYRIVDLGSSNGTFVNDIPLPANQPRELRDGDRITMGPFTLTLQATTEPAVKPDEQLFGGLRVQEAPAAPEPAMPAPIQAEPPAEQPARPLPPVRGSPPRLPIESWVGMSAESGGGWLPSRWLQYLPYYFSEDPFLGQYLLIFEDLLGPVEQLIAHFSLLLDPRTAPENFLPTLAAWLGLELDDRWPLAQRRAILRAAVEWYDWRGTKKGLARLLEVGVGCPVEVIENPDGAHTFCVRLTPAAGQSVDEQMVRYLIEANKPAQTVYRLEIQPKN